MSFTHFEPNPVHPEGGVGDCAIRAIAAALDLSWEEAYTRLALNGFLMGDLPNSDIVWGSVLRKEGFVKETIPNTCPDCYTVAEFARDNPKGIYVLKSDGHVATVIDGVLYDSWNSGSKIPIYYWTEKGD